MNWFLKIVKENRILSNLILFSERGMTVITNHCANIIPSPRSSTARTRQPRESSSDRHQTKPCLGNNQPELSLSPTWTGKNIDFIRYCDNYERCLVCRVLHYNHGEKVSGHFPAPPRPFSWYRHSNALHPNPFTTTVKRNSIEIICFEISD